MLGQQPDGTPLILVGAEAPTLERRLAAMSAGAVDYSRFQLVRTARFCEPGN